MATLLPPANATGPCDRRMSRAARQLLVEQLVPLLDHWLQTTQMISRQKLNKEGKVNTPVQQLQLPRPLSQRTSSHGDTATTPPLTGPQTSLAPPTFLWETLQLTASPECPLLRDVYRHFDEQSFLLRPRAPKLAPRRTYPHWFSCGICGKEFSSRYYLDRHQHLHHNNKNNNSSSSQEDAVDHRDDNNEICLDHLVCGALGGCDQVALDLEPYYGRGSGFGGHPDAIAVRRTWASQIEPCRETFVQTILKPNCRRLVEDCFHHNNAVDDDQAPTIQLNQLLQDTLCEPLSCHALLHRQELMHRHWIRSTSSLWHPVHPSWRTVGLVLGLLGIFYFSYYMWMAERGSHGGKVVGGRKLLQKNKRPASFAWLSTFRRRTKKKVL